MLESSQEPSPQPPCLPGLDVPGLIAVDTFILELCYRLAFEGLDRLDLAVGGDPHLDVQQAGIYWTMASVTLDTKDWGLLVSVFRGLERDLTFQVRDLTSVPE